MTRRHRGAASESDEVARRWWTLPWSALPVAADRPTLAADQSPGSGFYNTTTGAAPAPTTAPGDSPLTRPGGPVPTPEPMLPPRRFKPVAESLMRRPPEPSGFDVPASVERIARGIPILEWPSQLRRRAAGRVLVLLDHNENMQATAADGVALAAWLATVAGGSLVTTARFRGDPKARGGPDWSAFDRVIVFGSFGAALPILAQSRHEPDAATWLRYARAASRQGTDVVAVVPFDRDRVAAPLVNGPGQRLIAVVPWSEATSVRDVHRSVGRLSGATRG